jgi:hypothetical protein
MLICGEHVALSHLLLSTVVLAWRLLKRVRMAYGLLMA